MKGIVSIVFSVHSMPPDIIGNYGPTKLLMRTMGSFVGASSACQSWLIVVAFACRVLSVIYGAIIYSTGIPLNVIADKLMAL